MLRKKREVHSKKPQIQDLSNKILITDDFKISKVLPRRMFSQLILLSKNRRCDRLWHHSLNPKQ